MIPLTLLESLGSFAWKNWQAVLGGIGCAVLGLMLVFAKADARHQTKRADQATQGWNLELAKNTVNLSSIATLQAALNDKNAESEARAKALADSKASDAANANANDAKRKADASRQGFIEGVRDHATSNPTCPVPKGLTDALGGIVMRYLVPLILLAGCAAKPAPPAVQIRTVEKLVEIQRPCAVKVPVRPAPLAKPLPADAVALAAVVALKLREWSGPGQYGDQAEDALRVCTHP